MALAISADNAKKKTTETSKFTQFKMPNLNLSSNEDTFIAQNCNASKLK